MAAEVTMKSVIELLGQTGRYRITDGASNNICPVCGDPGNPRKKKLNINFRKNTFRCPKCDFSGNALQFWAWHRGISDTKEAYADYQKCYEGVNGKVQVKKPRATYTPKIKENPIADVEKRDIVYRALLNELYLSDKHRENLKNRGLDDKAIEVGGYKTLPKTLCQSLAKTLLNKGFKLEGIPGFYKYQGNWRFIFYGDGFLIPVKTVDGKIYSLQLRKDTCEEGDCRYFTISTAERDGGTKGEASPHFTPGVFSSVNEVIITEGPLKANIISHFTEKPVIGVLGVNSISKVPEMLQKLKEAGLVKIQIAYDMDMITNPHVLKACGNLEHMIAQEGVRYEKLSWDPKQKGLDDFLLSLQKAEAV